MLNTTEHRPPFRGEHPTYKLPKPGRPRLTLVLSACFPLAHVQLRRAIQLYFRCKYNTQAAVREEESAPNCLNRRVNPEFSNAARMLAVTAAISQAVTGLRSLRP